LLDLSTIFKSGLNLSASIITSEIALSDYSQ